MPPGTAAKWHPPDQTAMRRRLRPWRYSTSSRGPFAELHDLHAQTRFPMACRPFRESGMRWSMVTASGPSQWKHRPCWRSNRRRKSRSVTERTSALALRACLAVVLRWSCRRARSGSARRRRFRDSREISRRRSRLALIHATVRASHSARFRWYRAGLCREPVRWYRRWSSARRCSGSVRRRSRSRAARQALHL